VKKAKDTIKSLFEASSKRPLQELIIEMETRIVPHNYQRFARLQATIKGGLTRNNFIEGVGKRRDINEKMSSIYIFKNWELATTMSIYIVTTEGGETCKRRRTCRYFVTLL
jgi:hypothetical protein